MPSIKNILKVMLLVIMFFASFLFALSTIPKAQASSQYNLCNGVDC